MTVKYRPSLHLIRGEITLTGRIGELSRKKGHVYHTNVYDIASEPRRLIWSGEGRSKKTLERFSVTSAISRPNASRRCVAICGATTSTSSRSELPRLGWCSTSST